MLLSNKENKLNINKTYIILNIRNNLEKEKKN